MLLTSCKSSKGYNGTVEQKSGGKLTVKEENIDYLQSYMAVEKKQLERFKSYIRREKETLTVTTDSGEEIELKNNLTASPYEYNTYEFIDYFKDIHCLVVKNVGWEWESYLLYRLDSGLSFRFPDFPYFSPDNKTIIVCKAALHIYSAIYIYTFSDASVILNRKFETDFYPQDPGWVSNSEVEITKMTIVDLDKYDYSYRKGSIVKVGGEWVIR